MGHSQQLLSKYDEEEAQILGLFKHFNGNNRRMTLTEIPLDVFVSNQGGAVPGNCGWRFWCCTRPRSVRLSRSRRRSRTAGNNKEKKYEKKIKKTGRLHHRIDGRVAFSVIGARFGLHQTFPYRHGHDVVVDDHVHWGLSRWRTGSLRRVRPAPPSLIDCASKRRLRHPVGQLFAATANLQRT